MADSVGGSLRKMLSEAVGKAGNETLRKAAMSVSAFLAAGILEKIE